MLDTAEKIIEDKIEQDGKIDFDWLTDFVNFQIEANK